jgi:hypothetical protein
MGIRLKSGAIPVAVKAHTKIRRGGLIGKLLNSSPLFIITGRLLRCAKPEDLPFSINNHSKLSGERHGM